MSKNWMRHFELQVVDKDGKGIDLASFKVTFSIEWYNISSMVRIGTFRIYNLAPDTVQLIMGEKYTRIRAIAGYDGIAPDVDASQVGVSREVDPDKLGQQDDRNYGVIFDGEIRYSLSGKENPVDSYVLIQAVDSQRAFATSVTSMTLSAGYNVADYQAALMKNFSAFGAEQGTLPEMPTTVFPRGRTMLGMTRDYMDNVAEQCTATWMFVDGKVEMLADNQVMHDAVDLNSDTGLIGMPQQTIGNGINVRCLINPNISVNGLIRLNQRDVVINRASLPGYDVSMSKGRFIDQDANGNSNVALPASRQMTASIATDGVYKVISIMYTGDTRGQAWYMDMMCEARGAQDLYSQSALQKG